jgi:hypothetical protein
METRPVLVDFDVYRLIVLEKTSFDEARLCRLKAAAEAA